MLKVYVSVQRKLADLQRNCEGVSSIEYVILAAAIITVVAAAVTQLDLGTVFGAIGTRLATAVTPAA